MRYFLLRPETLFLLCISLALWSYFFHTDEVKTIVKSSRDAVKMVKGKVAEIMQNDRLGGLDVLEAEFSKTWEFKSHNVAVYSIQGRRDHMEDRFEVLTDLANKTHPSIFGIFDGHGAFQETEIKWREDEKMTLQVEGKRKCYGRSKMQAQLEKTQLFNYARQLMDGEQFFKLSSDPSYSKAGSVSRCRWDLVSSPALSMMLPKKGGDGIKPPPIIGRFGTCLKIGIVGLPNVGKSTFFSVLTNSQASAENFPFCTFGPNESRVPAPDERFDFLCQYHKPASKIPAFLNVVDIAGLVKGAHNGQGLGNDFLSHISACDGIFHLTCAFEDDDITRVEGSVDPIRDREIIHE
ncbi:hypothetical protein GH733_002755 [Mirounga leonina]|nr:hypothetical protein GH733_002755 [Mirounga leonina]